MIILHFDLQPQFKYMNYFIYTSHHCYYCYLLLSSLFLLLLLVLLLLLLLLLFMSTYKESFYCIKEIIQYSLFLQSLREVN